MNRQEIEKIPSGAFVEWGPARGRYTHGVVIFKGYHTTRDHNDRRQIIVSIETLGGDTSSVKANQIKRVIERYPKLGLKDWTAACREWKMAVDQEARNAREAKSRAWASRVQRMRDEFGLEIPDSYQARGVVLVDLESLSALLIGPE